MILAPVIWVLTVVICYFFIAKTWWFPPPISQHGISYDAQFHRTLIVTGIIFFLAQVALGYVIWRFRDDGKAPVIRTATTSWKLSGPARPRCCSWAWC